MTTAELIRRASLELPRRPGIPDPGREARWLLAAAWGVPEPRLLARPDEPVPDPVRSRYLDWVRRRAAGHPAEHLVGRCAFWGRDFEVSPAVLVPRPETELVIQTALELGLSRTTRVADIGTGSGCLAITLALERPEWRVVAVDRSLAALRVARINGCRHDARVRLVCGDLATGIGPPVDLVVANLPYIPSRRWPELPVEVRHDPRSALDGGADGLDLVRRLLDDLPRVLRPCGGVILELGEGQAEAVARSARSAGLAVARSIRDVAGVDRLLVLQPA